MGFLPGESEVIPFASEFDYTWKGRVMRCGGLPYVGSDLVFGDGFSVFEESSAIARPIKKFGQKGRPLYKLPKIAVLFGTNYPGELDINVLRDALKDKLEAAGIWCGLSTYPGIPFLGQSEEEAFFEFTLPPYLIGSSAVDGDGNPYYVEQEQHLKVNWQNQWIDPTRWQGYEILWIHFIFPSLSGESMIPQDANINYGHGPYETEVTMAMFENLVYAAGVTLDSDDDFSLVTIEDFQERNEDKITAETQLISDLTEGIPYKRSKYIAYYFDQDPNEPSGSGEGEEERYEVALKVKGMKQELIREIIPEVVIYEQDERDTINDDIIQAISEFYELE